MKFNSFSTNRTLVAKNRPVTYATSAKLKILNTLF